eukprot:5393163-Pyramimonas_sp.AAC.1
MCMSWRSVTIVAPCGCLAAILGCRGVTLGRLDASSVNLGALLGPSWAVLGLSGAFGEPPGCDDGLVSPPSQIRIVDPRRE